VSGTLYAQTLRRGMKHASCVRYIICPDVVSKNETRNLCPVHYMPRRCGEEWNTQVVSGTLYAQTLCQRMKLAICVRYIICPDVAERNETRKLCPVHYMPRHCVKEWNSQFESGTLYAQTLRQRMKHAICVRYIICPDIASKNETRNLCPVHYMPRHCVKEWNTQFVSSALYAQTLRQRMKHAICARYITCSEANQCGNIKHMSTIHPKTQTEKLGTFK